jgi:hypothetical protein
VGQDFVDLEKVLLLLRRLLRSVQVKLPKTLGYKILMYKLRVPALDGNLPFEL